ncbi:hypothetical protein OH77DRAFT_1594224 [Trametes cingulata]|nr:hypothetical protein OH77DRAFT_1594224 [Trametes cingulata]
MPPISTLPEESDHGTEDSLQERQGSAETDDQGGGNPTLHRTERDGHQNDNAHPRANRYDLNDDAHAHKRRSNPDDGLNALEGARNPSTTAHQRGSKGKGRATDRSQPETRKRDYAHSSAGGDMVGRDTASTAKRRRDDRAQGFPVQYPPAATVCPFGCSQCGELQCVLHEGFSKCDSCTTGRHECIIWAWEEVFPYAQWYDEEGYTRAIRLDPELVRDVCAMFKVREDDVPSYVRMARKDGTPMTTSKRGPPTKAKRKARPVQQEEPSYTPMHRDSATITHADGIAGESGAGSPTPVGQVPPPSVSPTSTLPPPCQTPTATSLPISRAHMDSAAKDEGHAALRLPEVYESATTHAAARNGDISNPPDKLTVAQIQAFAGEESRRVWTYLMDSFVQTSLWTDGFTTTSALGLAGARPLDALRITNYRRIQEFAAARARSYTDLVEDAKLHEERIVAAATAAAASDAQEGPGTDLPGATSEGRTGVGARANVGAHRPL